MQSTADRHLLGSRTWRALENCGPVAFPFFCLSSEQAEHHSKPIQDHNHTLIESSKCRDGLSFLDPKSLTSNGLQHGLNRTPTSVNIRILSPFFPQTNWSVLEGPCGLKMQCARSQQETHIQRSRTRNAIECTMCPFGEPTFILFQGQKMSKQFQNNQNCPKLSAVPPKFQSKVQRGTPHRNSFGLAQISTFETASCPEL